MLYCVDTSAWLDGWQRHYPRDVFPSLWARLDDIISSGQIICTEEVYIELQRKDDDLHKWMMSRKHMLVPLDEAIQNRATVLLREHPRLVDTLRGRSKADPFVIATAIERGAVVVTGEVLTGKLEKPRIPDVCRAKGIACIGFQHAVEGARRAQSGRWPKLRAGRPVRLLTKRDRSTPNQRAVAVNLPQIHCGTG